MIYISLKTPKSVNSKSVKTEIEKLIKKGHKTSEIAWKMEFTTTEKIAKEVSDKFQVVKNKIAFDLKG